MLDQEADESLIQLRPAKPQSVLINLNDSSQDITNQNISFRAPQVIKGPMAKRAKDPLEKKGAKKQKSGTKKPKSGTKKGNEIPLVINFVSDDCLESIVCIVLHNLSIIGAGNIVKANSLAGEGSQQFTVSQILCFL